MPAIANRSIRDDAPGALAGVPAPPVASSAAPASPPRAMSLDEAVDAACSLVAPLWPLRHFVAVNPYLGLSDRPFREAVTEVDRLFHGESLMPLAFYLEQQASGRITDEDIAAALEDAPSALARPALARMPAAALRQALVGGPIWARHGAGRVPTLAEAIDLHEGGIEWSRLVVDEIARWCAGRFDAGQAAWRQPWRQLPLYAAWREAAVVDRSPEIRGLGGFREYVKRLPEKPMDAIATILDQLGISAEGRRDYLARQLASIAGWAGHVQYRVRQAAFEGHRDDSLQALLAIRLAFDGAIDRALGERAARAKATVHAALGTAAAAIPGAVVGAAPEPGDALLRDDEARFVWQLAYEHGYRRSLIARLGAASSAPDAEPEARPRPALQAVFCIDVRSEVVRRHLESLSPAIQTIGFAGFFGMPLEYVPVGDEHGAARCPVLIAPSHRIRERAPDGEAQVIAAGRRHRLFTAVRKLTVGAFPMVETVGHFFGLRMITDALGWTQPHEDGALFGSRWRGALGPDPEVDGDGEATFGLPLSDRIDWAEGALRNMGLTAGFAEVVLLCGHGGASANNPYASGLDCGACGGHAGDVNARVAAALLESRTVRAGLAERGIEIPSDTRFIAALHDTTRDVITAFDAASLPRDARGRLETWLERACEHTRAERAARLGETPRRGLARRLRRRARDWSEVRPEWALARNAAFVAASRRRTRALDLEGRVFLHDYDPAADESGKVLELILSAPMVVASWINLQYYASTVDNEVFGSGDKVLHNVVGRHGVMLGNRSDLQTGLPWQSIHDGRAYVHEPMRLTAIVEAPRERIETVLAAHPEVRELVDNGWIHLIAWEPEGAGFLGWCGGQSGWRPLTPDAIAAG